MARQIAASSGPHAWPSSAVRNDVRQGSQDSNKSRDSGKEARLARRNSISGPADNGGTIVGDYEQFLRRVGISQIKDFGHGFQKYLSDHSNELLMKIQLPHRRDSG